MLQQLIVVYIIFQWSWVFVSYPMPQQVLLSITDNIQEAYYCPPMVILQAIEHLFSRLILIKWNWVPSSYQHCTVSYGRTGDNIQETALCDMTVPISKLLLSIKQTIFRKHTVPCQYCYTSPVSYRQLTIFILRFILNQWSQFCLFCPN